MSLIITNLPKTMKKRGRTSTSYTWVSKHFGKNYMATSKKIGGSINEDDLLDIIDNY